MLFRILSTLGIFLTCSMILRVLNARGLTLGQVLKSGRSQLSGFIKPVTRLQPSVRPWYILTLISFTILAITGFTQVIFWGRHMSGFLLLLHMIASPIFAAAFSFLTILTINAHRMNAEDWQAFKNRKNAPKNALIFWRKACYWIILVFSIPATASIILSMYPLFGASGQEALPGLHRYSTLILLIGVLFHTFLIAEGSPQTETSKDETSPSAA